MPYVLRYEGERVRYEPFLGLVDFFIKEDTKTTTDRDQAMEFETATAALEYAEQFIYPYPLKVERVRF